MGGHKSAEFWLEEIWKLGGTATGLILGAGSSLIGKVNINVTPTTPVLYRSNITAADVIAAMGTVTCTKIAGAGLTGGAYITNVVAGNAYGRGVAKVGSATITTETTNLRINAAFAAVPNATFYDIYCTTTTALWSGRITEAQRAAGVLLSTKGAGSAVNSVDIDVIGSGLAGSLAVQNTAYVMPAETVDCTGYQYVDFDCFCTHTGDAVAPSITVCPFYYDVTALKWVAGQAYTPSFGGASGAYGSMAFSVRGECRGRLTALVVQAIAGTGMSLTAYSVLS
ncbi:MAG: hypothetical protein WC455_25290 [Dehalococcoidia bacterium]|jgi:hypothetical protein